MERDFLKKLDIADDKIDKIMSQYGKDVQALNDKIDTNTSTIDGLNDQLSKRDAQIKDLGKQVGDNQALQDQITKFKDENKELSKTWQAKLDATKKNYAISNSLRDAGARNAKAVEALLDLDKVSLDDNGQLLGLSDQLDEIKKSDGYLFSDGDNKPEKDTNNGIKVFPNGNPAGNPTDQESVIDTIAKRLGNL